LGSGLGVLLIKGPFPFIAAELPLGLGMDLGLDLICCCFGGLGVGVFLVFLTCLLVDATTPLAAPLLHLLEEVLQWQSR